MIVAVHLYITGGNVHFITVFLNAVIVRLLFIVRTVGELVATIVQRAVSHETMLQRFIALLVPLEVSDHFLLLDEHAGVAVETMEMFSATNISISLKNSSKTKKSSPVIEIFAIRAATFDAGSEFFNVLRIVHLRRLVDEDTG